MVISCRNLSFEPTLSHDRLSRACAVFGEAIVKRMVSIGLYLLGATRPSIGRTVGMPSESVKTLVKTLLRDGLSALEDRRRSHSTFLPLAQVKDAVFTVEQNNEMIVIDFGHGRSMALPSHHILQIRTVLLSLYNARLLSVTLVAEALGVSEVHTRKLAQRLHESDATHLCDQRRGQQQDYRIDAEVKSELIQQYAAHAVTGRSTSSSAVADSLNSRLHWNVAARSVRHHISKLGLQRIGSTLPNLIQELKKTPRNSHGRCSEHTDARHE